MRCDQKPRREARLLVLNSPACASTPRVTERPWHSRVRIAPASTVVGFASVLCFGSLPAPLAVKEAESPQNRAIKTNIADSLNVVVHIERRPGRRYVSEILEINGCDPDADLFDYAAVFLSRTDPA